MKVALDLDGTIDAAPREFQSLMSALKAAGHTVVVVTGTQDTTATEADWQAKGNYLNSLGCGECWDQLVVLADPPGGDLHDAKAAWLEANDADVLIDNNVGNVKAAVAAGVPLVLCPWASKEK